MISTHVLDLASGRPASGLGVALDVFGESGVWERVAMGATDVDGRVPALARAAELAGKTVRLRFETGAYFEREQKPIFFPLVDITFVILGAEERYHVPLLLSPFGYSTYRGS